MIRQIFFRIHGLLLLFNLDKDMDRLSENILAWQTQFSELELQRQYQPTEAVAIAYQLLQKQFDIPYFAIFVNNQLLEINQEYYTEKHPYLLSNIRRFREGGIFDWVESKDTISILPDWETTDNNSSYLLYSLCPNKDTSILFIGAISKPATSIDEDLQKLLSFFLKSLLSYFSNNLINEENSKLRNQLSYINKKVVEQSHYATFGEMVEYGLQGLRATFSTIEAHFRFIDSGLGDVEARNAIIKKEFARTKDELDVLLKIYADSYSHHGSEINLNSLIEAFATFTNKLLLNRNIKLILDIEENLPTLNANHATLYYIFFNVLRNAILAMPDSGEFRIHLYSEKNAVHFVFADTGFGINEENLEQIFVPFANSVEKPNKMGISLYIIRNLLKQYNGNIKIASQEAKGTTVKIRIPIKSQS